jgi:hypothetical protein
VVRGRLFTAVIAAAISISVPGAALAGCMSGPADAPMAQMACCKNGHHECGKSGDAHDCCKSKHRQDLQNFADQQNLAKASSVTKLSADVSVLGVATSATSQASHHSLALSHPWTPLFAGTSSPPRIAFSILLI